MTSTPTFHRADHSWYRMDPCTVTEPHDCDGPSRTWVTGSNDHTPYHPTYPTGYNPKCGWCWLGYGHSEASHQQRIGGPS